LTGSKKVILKEGNKMYGYSGYGAGTGIIAIAILILVALGVIF
jgi:hypothetical protein